MTYNGHPLYFYVGDDKAGAVRGQDLNQFGGRWTALTAAGQSAGN